MSLHRTHIRKIVSALLLILFVCIQAEKNLHSHAQRPANFTHPDSYTFTEDQECFICDFQLAADADGPAEIRFEPVIIPAPVRSVALTGSVSFPSLLSIAERGPPARC